MAVIRFPRPLALLLALGALIAAEHPALTLPPDADYVQVRDGHLSLRGERVRYWGWIGHFWLEGKLKEHEIKADDSPEVRAAKVKKAYEVFDALAQRIHDTGFNLVRLWYEADWAKPYTKGDGSRNDLLAYSLAAMDKRGIKLWCTSFNDLGSMAPEHVSIIDEPGSADGWMSAIKELKNPGIRGAAMRGWDARTTAIQSQRCQEVANWPNHHKGGLRLGDDPQIAVWELTNEDWWATAMLNGHWQGLPKFFRDGYQAKWLAFLKKTYQDDAGLVSAWGPLLPGESVAQGNVVIINPGGTTNPTMVNDANPAALAALTAAKQAINRDGVSRQRTADVVRFVDELQITWKTAQRDAVRKMGRSLALSPILLDTGDGFRIQAVHLHQHGDASAMCTYLWQTAVDREQPHFPWVSGLEEQPRMGMGIPWVEVGRIPNKPFFVYEIQQNNPDKYRAEFPFRVAALGAVQDWDVVNFHLFGRPNDPALPEPYSQRMNYSHDGDGGGSIEGVHFKNDEIYTAALKAAGTFFIKGTLKPVAKPTVMTFGRKSLYDPRSADYGTSFGDLANKIMPTTYRFGLQMQVDPTQEEDSVVGPTVEQGLMQFSPLRPTPEITYDVAKGGLILDAPGGVSFTGFLAKWGGGYAFTNGVALSNVTVLNPPGMSYPIGADELYVSFAAVAQDGKPLAASKRVLVTLVSTSFNNGYTINEDNVAKGNLGYTGKPYQGQTQDEKAAIPVLVARAGGTVISKALSGMKYRLLDWHFRELGAGTVADGVLTIPADKPVFSIELTR